MPHVCKIHQNEKWKFEAQHRRHNQRLLQSRRCDNRVERKRASNLNPIALAYVAIENTIVGWITLWRPAVVFGVGLLHGMGFAVQRIVA